LLELSFDETVKMLRITKKNFLTRGINCPKKFNFFSMDINPEENREGMGTLSRLPHF
jgi:hypothetical protein